MRAYVINFLAIIFWLSAGITAEDDFNARLLAKHNYYRGLHGVPLLTLNQTMNKVSQTWADSLANRSAFEHSQNPNYGENLFTTWSSNKSAKLSGNEPADSWYSEIKMYASYFNTFGPPSANLSNVGHFTQLIWRDSQAVSVGLAKNYSDGWLKYYVVCNYWPRGNVKGKFKDNVPPPLGKK